MSLLSKRSLRKRAAFKKSKSVSYEYTTDDLPSLRRKRTIAHKRLCKTLEIAVLATSDDTQRDLFFSYHHELKQIASNFEDAHFNILELLNDDDHEDNDLQDSFDETYFKIQSIYRNLVKSEVQSASPQVGSTTSNIRLPKIVLPNFSGNIKEWPEYFDTFNALIHNCESLSDTEKFHYLRSSLNGDALSVIKAFPLTHEHYSDAYQTLIKRYQNKRDLAFTCWKDLLNINFRFNNVSEFRKSLDLFEENLTILKTINLPIAHWDFILVYHILSRLDTKLRQGFEEQYSNVELPTYAQLRQFLLSKCEALVRDSHFSDSIKHIKPSPSNVSFSQVNKRSNVFHTLVTTSEKSDKSLDINNTTQFFKCSFCNEAHSISSCQAFIDKSIDERMSIANERNWCFNCLKSSHQLKNCHSVFSCRKCNRKHHTLLHCERSTELAPASSLLSTSHTNTTVLLATAIVQVKTASGQLLSFRALFDSGSQNNLITKSAVDALKLKPTKSTINITGIAESSASILGEVCCSIGAENSVLLDLDMLVISKICGDQPIAKLNTSDWSHIQSLRLADPGFDIPGHIDLLFGAGVFADSLRGCPIRGNLSQPTAFNSIFGWLLFGKTRISSHPGLQMPSSDDHNLISLEQRFKEKDSLPKSSSFTPEENACEQHFESTHCRNTSGEYSIHLPFKDNIEPVFEGSRTAALRRFYAIERRLSRDSELCQQYAEFMAYINSGHISLDSPNKVVLGKHYVPHHCFLRPESTTMRLRVVFDASTNDSLSRSFNGSQLIGPKLQPNILRIDSSKDHPNDQRILSFPLNTVTYDVSPFPDLTYRTLRQLLYDEEDSYPTAKAIILSDIFVNNLVTGFKNLNVDQRAKSQLISLLDKERFTPRKWVTNDNRLLADVLVEDRLAGDVDFDNSEPAPVKVLGLKWYPVADSFLFDIKSTSKQCTKRAMLSDLTRIFDLLGFLSPFTNLVKCLIQKLWVIDAAWDDRPPNYVLDEWIKCQHQLFHLNKLEIPRRLTSNKASSYLLHASCDSSESAYSAVIHLRITDDSDRVHILLIYSEACVAPLKTNYVPRLKPCAALLLYDLFNFVKETYSSRISIDSNSLWSDSIITLSWIRSPFSRWCTFGTNRVNHFQELIAIYCWYHFLSTENPTDICSRGQFPCEIRHSPLWWAELYMLTKPHKLWPSACDGISPEDQLLFEAETCNSSPLVLSAVGSEVSFFNSLLQRYSSLEKIVRIMGYIFRFITTIREPANANRYRFLNNSERSTALVQIVNHVRCVFAEQKITSFYVIRAVELLQIAPFSVRWLNCVYCQLTINSYSSFIIIIY